MKFLNYVLMTKAFLKALQLLVNKIFNDGMYLTSWKTDLIKERGDLLGERLQKH